MLSWSREWRKHLPAIFEPADLPVIKTNAATITTLANPDMLGANPLQVERITLDADARTTSYAAIDAERFVYVVRGRGQAHVGEQSFPLDTEAVLWLEKSDMFFLEAGADGLEVLLCRAPAGE